MMISDQIFIASSGVQKEKIEPDDLLVQNLDGEDIIVPEPEKKLSKSQCTPIFMCAYTGKLNNQKCFIFLLIIYGKNLERNAGAVIHVHSMEAVKLCLLNPENELRITGLEMMKVSNNYEMVFSQIKVFVNIFREFSMKKQENSMIMMKNLLYQ